MDYSVIIPEYNCEMYLKSIVNNILCLKGVSYEIIIVDDGSSDSSSYLCDELAKYYNQIQIIHQRNHGSSASRNIGLQLATGKYISFLDSDDSIEVMMLSQLLEELKTEQSADMGIYGLSFDYYHNSKLYRRDNLCSSLKRKQSQPTIIDKIYELFLDNVLSPVWNKVFRRELLTDNNIEFDESMIIYEDMDFSIRCMEYCSCYYFFPEVVYHYRQSEDERNAGRRLKRICHLDNVVNKVEGSFDWLKSLASNVNLVNDILLSLYQVLVREKLMVSSISEMRVICDDFSSWYQKKNFENPKDEFTRNVLKGYVFRIKISLFKSAFRHRIALRIKSLTTKRVPPT